MDVDGVSVKCFNSSVTSWRRVGPLRWYAPILPAPAGPPVTQQRAAPTSENVYSGRQGYVTYLSAQQARGSCAFKRLALGTSRHVGRSAGFLVRRLPSGGRDVQTGVRGAL
jgi:hypothetical protein